MDIFLNKILLKLYCIVVLKIKFNINLNKSEELIMILKMLKLFLMKFF